MGRYRILALCLLIALSSIVLAQHKHSQTIMPRFDTIVEEEYVRESILMDPKEKWASSDNVALYYGIKPIKSVTLPIHVNLIFVGFDGDGQNGIKIPTHSFEEWFDHLEHSIDHEIIPVGDENPNLKNGTSVRLKVKHRVMTRIVKVSPLVNTILEDAIMYHIRAEDPDYETRSKSAHDSEEDRFYVDAFKFSSLLVSLVRDLRLHGKNGYTIFVLNPKSPVSRTQRYGYRVGFSHGEIDVLHGSTAFKLPDSIHNELFKRRGDEELVHQVIQMDNSRRLTASERPVASKFSHWIDMTEESHIWAEEYVKRIVKGEGNVNSPVNCKDEDDPLCGFKNNKMEDRKMDIVKLAQKIALDGSVDEKQYLFKVQKFPWTQAECLVDNWISHSRVAFFDLSAGPFEWGPILARQGLKSWASMPRIDSANVQEILLEQQEENGIHPSEEDDQDVEKNQKQTDDHKTKDDDEQMKRWRDIRDRALEDAREAFAVLCSKRETQIPTQECMEMAAKLKELEQEVQIWTSDDADKEMHHAPFVLDAFMSKMGAFLSKTMKQLLIRPSPSFSTPYAEKIVFNIHLVLGQSSYDPLAPLHFNMQEFKHELSLLKLPGQEITYNFRKHNIRDGSNPRLSMAVQHALKTEYVPRMSTTRFYQDLVTYLDARTLQKQLELLFPEETRPAPLRDALDPQKNFPMTRIIPIFIFSLHATPRDAPILLDKFFSSRGMSNMVLVVQSNQSMYETRWQCNKEPIFWNMANPVRHALAATSLTAFGLVAQHFGVDPASGKLIKDHLWSVGNNPFSGTSHGSHFSGFHKDAAVRSVIAQSIQSSIETFNDGVSTLQSIRTTLANFKGTSFLPAADLLEARRYLISQFTAISEDVEFLDWDAATSRLSQIERAVRQFRDNCKSSVEMMDIYKCMVEESSSEREQRSVIWNFFLFPLAICAYLFAVLLYICFRGLKKKKSKQA